MQARSVSRDAAPSLPSETLAMHRLKVECLQSLDLDSSLMRLHPMASNFENKSIGMTKQGGYG